MTLENAATDAGMLLYLLAAAIAVLAEARRRPALLGAAIGVLVAALAVHAVGIGLRWQRLGHGPYVNQYEILSSNIHTLHTALLFGVLAVRRLRPLLSVALPFLSVMVVWFLAVVPVDSGFPVTYDTVWLPIHVWLGKIFLGLMVVAVGGCLVILLRWALHAKVFPALPSAVIIDEINYRLVLLAFVFDGLMLIAGAVWAQDAWGRFWSWDPLETWSLLTWVGIAGYLHLRVTRRIRPQWSAMMLMALFALAYFTFFGVPFVSTAAHRGVI